ncbi:MAG TPA: response regulator [Candidatus Acidoferrales bacterium]|nr:response regulator [Candidatus Acidoferrales bacterium]
MESTTAVQEINTKAEGAASSGNFVERRRRRRAKISAQLHIRTVNTPEAFEEVCMTVDVSRDGLLFLAQNRGYWKGQTLQVTFPFSTDAHAINQAQSAEVVRVTETAGGKYAIAVQFEAAAVQAKDADKSGAFSVSAVASQAKQQQMVLAVESDNRTAEIMRNLLQQDGYNVVLVSTAQEALDILRTAVPAVFIAEVEAEDMSGHDLCLIIKRNERLQRVPVILLTRAAQPADYTASHQLGAVVCMAKPFQPERLLHVVRLVAPPPSMKTVYGASRGMTNAIERTL